MQDAKWSIYENLSSCPKNACKSLLICYIFHFRYLSLHKNGSLCPNLSKCCLLFWVFAAKFSFPSTYKRLETGIKQLKNIQSKEKRWNKKTKPVEISLNERGGGRNPDWSDLGAGLGTGQAQLAQTAAVIVQPGQEYLPGPVRRWLWQWSPLKSRAAFFLAKTSLSTNSKALHAFWELRAAARWAPWLGPTFWQPFFLGFCFLLFFYIISLLHSL